MCICFNIQTCHSTKTRYENKSTIQGNLTNITIQKIAYKIDFLFFPVSFQIDFFQLFGSNVQVHQYFSYNHHYKQQQSQLKYTNMHASKEINIFTIFLLRIQPYNKKKQTLNQKI
eukprot:TRINITY_DN1987_c0_g1_i11.p3 TRINITY_DN1987_c0_g1~~TRINITY_DN1987_c0_g1_i11.p3  ORF type:complete len:115 (-),score=3.99 TRINITY_DN1987_c0_g1_i11:442-786(-)